MTAISSLCELCLYSSLPIFSLRSFFPPHWLVWALNLLWILILWCIYVATIFHGLLTCPLSAHGVPRSPLMGNHRKFISDFYFRRSWASSQKLVWGLSPLWIHVTDSLLLFWLQGSSGQTLLTSSNGPELPSRHPVTWSSSLSSHFFPLVQFHCPFLFLFSGFITSVSCLQPFFCNNVWHTYMTLFPAWNSPFHRGWNWGAQRGSSLSQGCNKWVNREEQTHTHPVHVCCAPSLSISKEEACLVCWLV